ncbi:hypothetical protein GLOTRDRAFT_124632 [Gloeophyllum trabeum ATCC 11539]|uniref:Mitochondrial import inner membrane translocase subunit n=1 Tax=Gloeophyllum trabeum (strain ATCC 11539 / FP-39264 / Madison 617) TaxID=670483 RepID=S7S0K7_GLOTA|nr:uncharacterized protein GLOTRDRAFT_124632 [Gloeophyllum trabeum ATCC 11539]EPQ60890.1 hypothetical protein GLOTRDRAFT_124632 [Gloeophyllum trabeum ATCC 11539]
MSQFNEETQKEMQTFIEQLRASSQLQQNIANFTNKCWDKCVSGTPSTSFSSSEQGCLANCVERFLDTSVFIVKRIEEQRANRGFT